MTTDTTNRNPRYWYVGDTIKMDLLNHSSGAKRLPIFEELPMTVIAKKQCGAELWFLLIDQSRKLLMSGYAIKPHATEIVAGDKLRISQHDVFAIDMNLPADTLVSIYDPVSFEQAVHQCGFDKLNTGVHPTDLRQVIDDLTPP